MKIQEKNTKWDAEVLFYVNGVGPLNEYGQYYDREKRVIGCFVEVDQDQNIKIETSFHGTSKKLHVDAFVDGICRKAMCSVTQVDKPRIRKFMFDKLLYKIGSSVIDSDVRIVPLPSTITIDEDAEESLGTVEIQFSVEREPGEERPIFDVPMFYDESESVRQKPGTVGYTSVPPDYQTTFVDGLASLVLKDVNRQMKIIQAKRPGEEVWATFRFHYRSKETIEENSLRLTFDSNAKGKAKYKIPTQMFAFGDDGSGSEEDGGSSTRQSSPEQSVHSTLKDDKERNNRLTPAPHFPQQPTPRTTSTPRTMASTTASEVGDISSVLLSKDHEAAQDRDSSDEAAANNISIFDAALESVQQSSAAEIGVDNLSTSTEHTVDKVTDGIQDQAPADKQPNLGKEATEKDKQDKTTGEVEEAGEDGGVGGGSLNIGVADGKSTKNDNMLHDEIAPKTNGITTNGSPKESAASSPEPEPAKKPSSTVNGVRKPSENPATKADRVTTNGNSKPTAGATKQGVLAATTTKKPPTDKPKGTPKPKADKPAPKSKDGTQPKTPKKTTKPAASTTTPKTPSKNKRAADSDATASGTPTPKRTKPAPLSTSAASPTNKPSTASTTPATPSTATTPTFATQFTQYQAQLAQQKREANDMARRQAEVDAKLAKYEGERMKKEVERVRREVEERERRNREVEAEVREKEMLLERLEMEMSEG